MALKEYLSAEGVRFANRDISDPLWRDELVSRYGRLATPTIVVGDRVFVGFNSNRKEIEDVLKSHGRMPGD